MINKFDIKDICAKMVLNLESSIDIDEFMDMFQDDYEWDNIDEIEKDIKEYLKDNIRQIIENYVALDMSFDDHIEVKSINIRIKE